MLPKINIIDVLKTDLIKLEKPLKYAAIATAIATATVGALLLLGINLTVGISFLPNISKDLLIGLGVTSMGLTGLAYKAKQVKVSRSKDLLIGLDDTSITQKINATIQNSLIEAIKKFDLISKNRTWQEYVVNPEKNKDKILEQVKKDLYRENIIFITKTTTKYSRPENDKQTKLTIKALNELAPEILECFSQTILNGIAVQFNKLQMRPDLLTLSCKESTEETIENHLYFLIHTETVNVIINKENNKKFQVKVLFKIDKIIQTDPPAYNPVIELKKPIFFQASFTIEKGKKTWQYKAFHKEVKFFKNNNHF